MGRSGLESENLRICTFVNIQVIVRIKQALDIQVSDMAACVLTVTVQNSWLRDKLFT